MSQDAVVSDVACAAMILREVVDFRLIDLASLREVVDFRLIDLIDLI